MPGETIKVTFQARPDFIDALEVSVREKPRFASR